MINQNQIICFTTSICMWARWKWKKNQKRNFFFYIFFCLFVDILNYIRWSMRLKSFHSQIVLEVWWVWRALIDFKWIWKSATNDKYIFFFFGTIIEESLLAFFCLLFNAHTIDLRLLICLLLPFFWLRFSITRRTCTHYNWILFKRKSISLFRLI